MGFQLYHSEGITGRLGLGDNKLKCSLGIKVELFKVATNINMNNTHITTNTLHPFSFLVILMVTFAYYNRFSCLIVYSACSQPSYPPSQPPGIHPATVLTRINPLFPLSAFAPLIVRSSTSRHILPIKNPFISIFHPILPAQTLLL